jgi:nucleotidyltransferase AbiEii toxin of type IV toxin-antitoxin system
MDANKVLAVLRALSSGGVKYKVVGGVALNLHGIARTTEDLDIFVAPDAENVARLRAALRSVFADPHIDEITAEDLAGEYPAIQYVPPDGSFSIDLLARLGTAFSYDDIGLEDD